MMILANPKELKLLGEAVQAAARAKRDLDVVFEAFCAAHDLEPGMALVGLAENAVVVQEPEPLA